MTVQQRKAVHQAFRQVLDCDKPEAGVRVTDAELDLENQFGKIRLNGPWKPRGRTIKIFADPATGKHVAICLEFDGFGMRESLTVENTKTLHARLKHLLSRMTSVSDPAFAK